MIISFDVHIILGVTVLDIVHNEEHGNPLMHPQDLEGSQHLWDGSPPPFVRSSPAAGATYHCVCSLLLSMLDMHNRPKVAAYIHISLLNWSHAKAQGTKK